MFTGIIEEVGRIQRLGGGSLTIAAKEVLQDVHVGDSIALELRFKVNTVSTSSPYYTMDVELYVNGTQKVSGTRPGTTDTGEGLRYYDNLPGTFVIKKLS